MIWNILAGINLGQAASYALPLFAFATLTPLTELSVSHTELDAYSETGGAFAVDFDESTETERRLRLGTEIRAPISKDIEGWAWVAWNKRLTESPTDVAGQVQGLFAFGLEGANTDGDGVDAGVGASWAAAPGLDLLTSVGASFTNEYEPEINGRIGARFALSTLQ